MGKVAVDLVYDARAVVGESPVWDPRDACLRFVDIETGRVFRHDPQTGATDVLEVGGKVGCLALRESGGAVIGTDTGIFALDLATGARSLIADPDAGRRHNRFNDAAVDPCGRWWAGTCALAPPARGDAAFFRLDPDHRAHEMLSGFHTTNGLAFSPDGHTMYASDSDRAVRTIWAFDYDPRTGTPSNRRVFFDTRQVAGRPDGAAIDEEGCYWMAGVGGWQLVRITPAGRVDRIVDLPVERPSKPVFGGPGLEVIYVTSIAAGISAGSEADQPHRGGVFAVTGHGTRGFAQPFYAG